MLTYKPDLDENDAGHALDFLKPPAYNNTWWIIDFDGEKNGPTFCAVRIRVVSLPLHTTTLMASLFYFSQGPPRRSEDVRKTGVMR